MKRLLPLLLLTFPLCAEPAASSHHFAWPFIAPEKMTPRGGTTTGSEVTLATAPKPAWTRLQEPGLAPKEKDRRAILALAGEYRVSFDFIETLGFANDYQPPRPYFSWGTEHVAIIEDDGDRISLQHSLVMVFKNEKGEIDGPHVMKHWRQDWTWQDAEIHAYAGYSTWQREKSSNPEGRWSQAVFQVDDSPRYEVMGAWTHSGGLSTWRSDNCPRPLPRREFSVRKDYNVLEGFHEITLAPNGWIHVQNNRKLQLEPDGSRRYLGTEIGFSRYEEITSPVLAEAADKSWAKTGGYWKSVRETWAGILREKDRFTLLPEVDGEKLFEVHFEYADGLEKAEASDPAADAQHARETVNRFLVK